METSETTKPLFKTKDPHFDKLSKSDLWFRLQIYQYTTEENPFFSSIKFTVVLVGFLLFGNKLNGRISFLKKLFGSKKLLNKQITDHVGFKIFLTKLGYNKKNIVSWLKTTIEADKEENKPDYLKELEGSVKNLYDIPNK